MKSHSSSHSQRFLIAWALFVVVTPWGCNHLTDPLAGGMYHYASYDSSGVPLVKGWFTMDLTNPDSVTGEWHFSPIGNPQHIGPQTGDGELLGSFVDSALWIELQPQYRDNNLELAGTIKGGRYAGRWMWISFRGVTNSGEFEALKK
jgi:hypothetical protein